MSDGTLQKVVSTLAVLALALTVDPGYAQPNNHITYQGFLEQDGTPAEGAKTLSFRIYEAVSGGAPIWEETHANVDVRDGVFVASLGSIASLRNVPFGRPLFISIALGENQASEIGQRIPLTGVPYAQAVPRTRRRFADSG